MIRTKKQNASSLLRLFFLYLGNTIRLSISVRTRDIRIISSLYQVFVFQTSYDIMSTPGEFRPEGRGLESQDDMPAWAQAIMLRLEAMEVRTRESLTLGMQPGNQDTTPITPASGEAHSQQRVQSEEPLRTKPRKARLPDPERFEGQRSDFKAWLAQTWAKLEVDMSEDPSDVRFWYVHSRLGGSALNQITPWVAALVNQSAQKNETAIAGLIKQLENAYDDPASAQRASERLGTMQQGTRPFTKYLALFERTLLEADGLNWTDSAKKSMLTRGISDDLSQALIGIPKPASYEAYCMLLHTTSHDLEAHKSRQRGKGRSSEKQRFNLPGGGNQMDWEPTQEVRLSKGQSSRGRDKEKARTIQKKPSFRGDCFRCGEAGHMIRDCEEEPPKRKKLKPPTVATAKSRTKGTSKAAKGKEDLSSSEASSSEGQDTESEDSGKE
jgi:Retrotransposon gag protein/Zinc knuckle